MATTIKVGPKGRYLEIPEGWRLIEEDERIIKGDKAADIHRAKWDDVDTEDIGMYKWQDYAIREIDR